MGEYVRVESVEALGKFRTALCKFKETVTVGLDEAEAEIQRVSLWLKLEQPNHWKRQVRKRAELRARAKSALNRKKMQKTPLGASYSCVDEEKALAAAERRLEEARQKLANVRRWTRLLDEESFSYKSVAQGMRQAVELDIPNALAQLDNMIASLEAYASPAAPGEQRSTAPTPSGEEIGPREQFASVSRETPAPPRDATHAYQKLRAQTPSQPVRDGTPIVEREFHWLKADKAGQSVPEALENLNVRRTPIADDDKIVVASGVWGQRRIYLERVENAAAGDSGWYVGFPDDSEVSGYEALRVADFLAERPDLQPLLEFPAGYLVVLDGASLEAVLDPQGILLWPAETSTQER